MFDYKLLFYYNKGGGVGLKMPPKKTYILQLQGGSPSNRDQYTLEQLCTKFGGFITM